MMPSSTPFSGRVESKIRIYIYDGEKRIETTGVGNVAERRIVPKDSVWRIQSRTEEMLNRIIRQEESDGWTYVRMTVVGSTYHLEFQRHTSEILECVCPIPIVLPRTSVKNLPLAEATYEAAKQISERFSVTMLLEKMLSMGYQPPRNAVQSIVNSMKMNPRFKHLHIGIWTLVKNDE